MQEKVAADMLMPSSQRQYFKSFMNLEKLLTRSSCYDKYLCIGYLNSKISETALKDLCDPH